MNNDSLGCHYRVCLEVSCIENPPRKSPNRHSTSLPSQGTPFPLSGYELGEVDWVCGTSPPPTGSSGVDCDDLIEYIVNYTENAGPRFSLHIP